MASMTTDTRVKLSVMMFLQYAFQGIWIIPFGFYLGKVGFTDAQIGSVYGTVAIGCIISPFFVGMIADRFFSAQKVLGILNIASAGLLLIASKMAVSTNGEPQVGLMWWLILAHCLCYMPTWALTNTIAFAQMNNPGKQFPGIRVMGTIGWIAVSAITLFSAKITSMLGKEGNIEATNLPMVFGAIIGGTAGLFAFFLPDTPPGGKANKVTVSDILGVKALQLFKDHNFCVFAISSFLILFPGMFYWAFCNKFLNEIGMKEVMFKQSYGQMAEMVFLLIMPWFFARFGVKKMLLFGMLAWIARFACFAFGDMSSRIFLLYMGLILHGACFDFFFVTGQLYTDKKAPKEIQASAQGLITLITFGLGWLIGSNLSGQIINHYATETTIEGIKTITHDWHTIWLYPVFMAIGIMLFFLFTFKDDVKVGQDNPETK
ncbi:MAG: MFS transporter [Phycisphaerae bacterium]|nr:MFS transporter [Phycisphaerae bacterium]